MENIIARDSGRFRVPNLCLKKVDTMRATTNNSRSVLGSIENRKPTGKDDTSSKPCLTKKMSFTHVRSKVDSNLNPEHKSIGGVLVRTLRKQESTSSLTNKQAALQKTKLMTGKLERNAKSCINLHKPHDEIGLSPEAIKKMEMIETADKLNPFMLIEYKSDIYKYLQSLEEKHLISKDFLAGMHVTFKMRAMLINWLVEVHIQFRLLLDTLHMTISILDRFLQETHDVPKHELQLVGVTAMIIACKYEEIYIHDLQEYVIMCDDAYTKRDMIKMECTILRTLKFNLSPPLPVHFLRRYSKVGGAEPIHHAMAKYFIELMLLDSSTCYYRPSEISSAAICLALALINERVVTHPKTVWTPVLQYFSTYKYSDIEPIIFKLANIVSKMPKSNYKAIGNKYSAATMMKVSQRPELQSILLKKLASKA